MNIRNLANNEIVVSNIGFSAMDMPWGYGIRPDRKEILRDQIEDLTKRMDVLQVAKDRLEFKLANYDTHLRPYETSLREGEQVEMSHKGSLC